MNKGFYFDDTISQNQIDDNMKSTQDYAADALIKLT